MMKAFSRNKLATAVAVLAGTATPYQSILAQDLMLEEVVVTAQKREQGLQDVPVAVSAVSGEKISDIGITNLEEVTLYTPNVSINQGAAQPNIFIRGVGSGTNAGFEQSVGLYIDGVYSGRGQLATVPMTMDLERIEILKGPQGILFGKNTIGGAINVTSAKPADEFMGMVDAQYAPEDGEQLYNLMLTGPITETLGGRLAVRYEGMDGWWDNNTLDEEGPDRDNFFARGTLRWYPTDTVEALLKYEHGDFEDINKPAVIYQSGFAGQTNFAGGIPFPVISDHDDGALDLAAGNETQVDTVALTVNWDLEFATFTSITAHASYELDKIQDTDYSALPALHRALNEEYSQVSQELRLVSPGGETIDWIVGAYYQQSELDVSRTNDQLDFALLGDLSVPALLQLPGQPLSPSTFDQDSDSWAIFAQGTWAVSDTLRLGLGLRYNEETKELDKINRNFLGARFGDLTNITATRSPAAPFAPAGLIEDVRSHSFTGLERDEEKATWLVNVQWDATDAMMVYASASTGFKGGGFDEAYSSDGGTIRQGTFPAGEPLTGVEFPTGVDASVLAYEEESVLAFEVGAKMSLAGGAAELNLALFRMQYEDLQVSSLVGDVFRVGNAGEAISQGLELDGRWLVAEGLTLGGSVAWLDAYYEEFTGATCTVPQASDPDNNPGCLTSDPGGPVRNIVAGESGGQDLTDETLLFAPDWSANLNAEYIMPLGDTLELRTNVDINYTDEFESSLDLDPNTSHDSYTKVNARIAIASIDDIWSVALIGKNLTDKDTRVWNNDVPATDSNSYFGIPERPRSIAIQGRYRF